MTGINPLLRLPMLIWDNCRGCGSKFPTNPRAIAEGRDVCKSCRRPRNDQHVESIAGMSRKKFQRGYDLYLRALNWWIAPTDHNAAIADQVCTAWKLLPEQDIDGVSLETREAYMLKLVAFCWSLYRRAPSTHHHRRLGYAIWCATAYYDGTSEK